MNQIRLNALALSLIVISSASYAQALSKNVSDQCTNYIVSKAVQLKAIQLKGVKYDPKLIQVDTSDGEVAVLDAAGQTTDEYVLQITDPGKCQFDLTDLSDNSVHGDLSGTNAPIDCAVDAKSIAHNFSDKKRRNLPFGDDVSAVKVHDGLYEVDVIAPGNKVAYEYFVSFSGESNACVPAKNPVTEKVVDADLGPSEDSTGEGYCYEEVSFGRDASGHYTYMTGIGPDGATPQEIRALNVKVGMTIQGAIRHGRENYQLCLSGAASSGRLVVTKAVDQPIPVAPAAAAATTTQAAH